MSTAVGPRVDLQLQRRASFRTHKGRFGVLNLRIRLSENRNDFRTHAVGGKYVR